jgi:hypothetical protein
MERVITEILLEVTLEDVAQDAITHTVIIGHAA